LVGGSFYPPDAAASGIDLEALPVIATPDVAAALRVAIHLARSGAFGLLILDLVSPPPVDHHGRAGVRRLPRTSGAADRQRAAQQLPTASFTKLAGLAQQHGVAVVFLTDALPEQPSLGSLISLRCDTQRQAAGEGRFLCVATALKDKRRGPGWSFAEVQLGPLGLR
jgi:recombination protein RecA